MMWILCLGIMIILNFSVEGKLNKFQLDMLSVHNSLRGKHGAAPLELNKELSDYAQDWAQQLAAIGKLEHRPRDSYGENLYSMTGRLPTALRAASNWYNEGKNYNYSTESAKYGTGHFTQMVWKGSRLLGVGMATSRSGKHIIVCNYYPPGNYRGQYVTNVRPPQRTV